MNPVVGAVDVGEVIGQVDIDQVMERVDVDAVVQRADIDAVVQRVDMQAVVAKVDLDELLGKVDINTLLDRIDVEALLARIDADALVGRIDVNALMERVDLDAMLERVDIENLMARANIDAIVRDASRGMFARGIDAVRRQIVGLDAILIGVVTRLFRRPRLQQEDIEKGTVTGQTAGGMSRLAAFLIDGVILSISFALTTALVTYLTELVLGDPVDPNRPGLLVFGGYSMFSFFYFWIGLSITGRSIGKGIVGLKVVGLSGAPITPGRAFVRQLVYPISFILGLGLISVVLGKNRRALHDWAGRDKVLYDWGDRPAELPAPLTAWVRNHSEDRQPAAEDAA